MLRSVTDAAVWLQLTELVVGAEVYEYGGKLGQGGRGAVLMACAAVPLGVVS